MPTQRLKPAKRFIESITDWLTLNDYEREKRDASARIIARQSRGNVNAQDGWYMTKAELNCNSRAADKSLKSLKKAFHLK